MQLGFWIISLLGTHLSVLTKQCCQLSKQVNGAKARLCFQVNKPSHKCDGNIKISNIAVRFNGRFENL